jgi:hypothetical protein
MVQIKNAVSIAVKIAGNSKERTITSEAIISTAKLLQSQEYQGKRLRAARDEETLETYSLKGRSPSTHNVDAVPVKPVSERLGSTRWHYEAAGMGAVAALLALACLMGTKLN